MPSRELGHGQYGIPLQSNESVHDPPEPLLLVLVPPEVEVPLEPPDEDPLDDVDVELDVEPPGPSPLTVVVQAVSTTARANVGLIALTADRRPRRTSRSRDRCTTRS